MPLSSLTSKTAFSSIFIPLSKVLFHLSLRVLVHCWSQTLLQLQMKITTASCTCAKVHDSQNAHRVQQNCSQHTGFSPSLMPFPKAYSCDPAGSASQDYKSGPRALISTPCLSLYIRHYWGNPRMFLVCHLLICLNSAEVSA